MFFFMNLKNQLIPILVLLFLFGCIITGCNGLEQQHLLQQQRQQQLLQQQKQKQQTKQLLADVKILQSGFDEQNRCLIRMEEAITKLQETVAAVDEKTTNAIKVSEAKIQKAIIKSTNIKKAIIKKAIRKDKKAQVVCSQGDKVMIGANEWVYLPVVNEHFKARVDSGATTSSISAKNVENFERDGKKWVRFDLEHKDDENSWVTLERPIERRVAIKQATSDEKESRPVISLMIKMGEISESTEFTLADRRQMLYPILLGRSFLRDVVLIDVSKKFLHPKYIPPPVQDTKAKVAQVKADAKTKKQNKGKK